jgi:hypothetical protein
MERRQFLAFAAALPLFIRFGYTSKAGLNHIHFVGSFGRQVKEELLFQLSEQQSFFERFPGLAFSSSKLHSAVVSDMGDPELPRFIKSIDANGEFRRSCIGYFSVDFKTENVSRKEDIARRFRMVHETLPHQRIFTDLDYEEPKAVPRWPMEWNSNRLTFQQKQIVWELYRNWTP